MNICEAIKEAAKGSGWIKRKSWDGTFNTKIYPTNTGDCCVISLEDNRYKFGRRWNPYKEDLIADDWEVAEGERIVEENGTVQIR